MKYFDYYIRCLPEDFTKLLQLAEAVGILRQEGGAYVPENPAWVWQPIGKLFRYVGPGPEDFEVIASPEGTPYEHANLRLTMDLLLYCQEVYTASPNAELAAAMANVSGFFFTQEVDGVQRAARPVTPSAVFL